MVSQSKQYAKKMASHFKNQAKGLEKLKKDKRIFSRWQVPSLKDLL